MPLLWHARDFCHRELKFLGGTTLSSLLLLVGLASWTAGPVLVSTRYLYKQDT